MSFLEVLKVCYPEQEVDVLKKINKDNLLKEDLADEINAAESTHKIKKEQFTNKQTEISNLEETIEGLEKKRNLQSRIFIVIGIILILNVIITLYSIIFLHSTSIIFTIISFSGAIAVFINLFWGDSKHRQLISARSKRSDMNISLWSTRSAYEQAEIDKKLVVNEIRSLYDDKINEITMNNDAKELKEKNSSMHF